MGAVKEHFFEEIEARMANDALYAQYESEMACIAEHKGISLAEQIELDCAQHNDRLNVPEPCRECYEEEAEPGQSLCRECTADADFAQRMVEELLMRQPKNTKQVLMPATPTGMYAKEESTMRRLGYSCGCGAHFCQGECRR
jgi:hypothetical protein